MRWFLPLILLLLAPPAFAQENAVEKYFLAMEKKVSEAKSLTVLFQSERQHGYAANRESYTGKLQVGEDNRCRFECEGTKDSNFSLLIVCDGKQMLTQSTPTTIAAKPRPAPPGLTAFLHTMPLRAGFLATAFQCFDEGEFLTDEQPIGGFKFGPKEIVGKNECQVIEYAMTIGKQENWVGSIWIGIESNFPVKLALKRLDEEKTHYLNESFTFTLNPQFDPKVFEFPKIDK